jgi:acyl-coenzyme A thioesterase PaaI-like protein
MTEQQRPSRTVEWDDPAPLAAAIGTMSGLEFLQAIVRGDLPQPPIMGVMSSEAVLAEEGHVEFRCTPDASHFNPLGTVHGGYACTVLDSAAACAGQTILP